MGLEQQNCSRTRNQNGSVFFLRLVWCVTVFGGERVSRPSCNISRRVLGCQVARLAVSRSPSVAAQADAPTVGFALARLG